MRIALFVFAALIALPCAASAKSERTTRYRYKTIWPTAIRHLRIDENFAIVEKDADSGYIVFEKTVSDKAYRGALELVQTSDPNDGPVVRLVLSIQARPEYEESAVLDRLVNKLWKELGDPPPPKPEGPPADNGDDDHDKTKGKGKGKGKDKNKDQDAKPGDDDENDGNAAD